MSTTSTTFEKRKRNARKLEPFKIKKRDSLDLYDRDESDDLSEKWSKDRVLDELSTFIAEYSYLTDEQDHKKDSPKRCEFGTCEPSYSVYQTNTSGTSVGILKHKNQDHYRNNTKHKKLIDWSDTKYPLHHERKRHKKKKVDSTVSSGYDENDTGKYDYTAETSEREHSRHRTNRGRKTPKNIFVHKKPRSKSRSSPFQERPKRSRSKHCSNTKITITKSPWVKRRSCSKPTSVKHIPVKYERRNNVKEICCPSDKKIPNVKRVNIRDPFVETKTPMLNQCPTIITLFPKNSKCDVETDFLTNPYIPCKCFQCKRKYETLVKFETEQSSIICETTNPFCEFCSKKDYVRQHQKTCTCQQNHFGTNKSFLHVKKVRIEPSENNLYYKFHPNEPMACQAFGGECGTTYETCDLEWPCSARRPLNFSSCFSPCEEDKFMTEWNMDSCEETNMGGKCFKSVYFKLNCVCHPVDSAVTKFFHSILRKKMCLY